MGNSNVIMSSPVSSRMPGTLGHPGKAMVLADSPYPWLVVAQGCRNRVQRPPEWSLSSSLGGAGEAHAGETEHCCTVQSLP